MPPSHPRPEDLAALGGALSTTAEDAAAAGETLLGHMVTVGDRGAQGSVDDLVDEAVDTLRELSASCRELALSLAAWSATSAGTTATEDSIRSPHVREAR